MSNLPPQYSDEQWAAFCANAGMCPQCAAERTARAQAERERDAALKDARRYRWLRGRNPDSLAAVAWGASKSACAFSSPDKAIDAAMLEVDGE